MFRLIAHQPSLQSRQSAHYAVWPLLCLAILVSLPQSAAAFQRSGDRFRDMRLHMVDEYIKKEGVTNARVLASMRDVPRHEFVPSHMRRQAYHDAALPLGHKQTISPPFIVAYMTETIEPQPEDRVLEIGTGSGYQAAVLAGLVREVYTIEIVEPLGVSAERRLKRLGYSNVHVKVGDGYQGWPEHAPFDKIIVTCSPEQVPEPLVEQLNEGGKMIIPLGERYQQVFHLFEKRDGKLVQQRLIPTLFVPMTGISEDQRETLPDPENPQIVNGNFEDDANQDGRPDNWHYQRQAELVEEGAPQGERFVRFQNSESGRHAQMLQGSALDGRAIAALQISLTVKVDQAVAGRESWEKPAFVVHFYDDNRRPIGEGVIGPWLGTADWKRVSSEIKIPIRTREVVYRVGLNCATGELSIDDIRMTPIRR
jgi:protein-L-isoaspartate(D-aspartate) O-methyltransferase